MLIGHLWSVSTALELVCHSLLAIASHKNARERAIVGMQQGPLFAGLTGKVSEACVLAAHSQWIKRLDPGPFLNLMKKIGISLSLCNIQIASAVYSTTIEPEMVVGATFNTDGLHRDSNI